MKKKLDKKQASESSILHVQAKERAHLVSKLVNNVCEINTYHLASSQRLVKQSHPFFSLNF